MIIQETPKSYLPSQTLLLQPYLGTLLLGSLQEIGSSVIFT